MLWNTLSSLVLVELCQEHGASAKAMDVVSSALSSFLNDNMIDCCDVTSTDCKQQIKIIEKQYQLSFASIENIGKVREMLAVKRLGEIELELQQVIDEYSDVREELEAMSATDPDAANDAVKVELTDDDDINISGLIQELAASDESDFLDCSIGVAQTSEPDVKKEIRENSLPDLQTEMGDQSRKIENESTKVAVEEDEKTYKQWKRSILLLWKSISNHKWANVFMSPVTDDIAPSYSKVVAFPMDLTTLRRRIENGVIRSDLEFARDILLMFQNAFVYNNSDHEIYKLALEMQNDCLGLMQQHFGASFFGKYEINVPEVRQPRTRTVKSFDKF